MAEQQKRKGRPRCFKEEEALEAAQEVFLARGFEGASLEKLTDALNIRKPSLYAAFGNKEDLFVTVLRRYHKIYRKHFGELVAIGLPPKEMISEWLGWFLENYKRQEGHAGCLIVNSTLLSSDNYPRIAKEIRSFHNLNQKLMADYLRREKRKGRFSGDPKATGQFLNAVVQGMAVLQRGQRNDSALRNIAGQALEVVAGQCR